MKIKRLFIASLVIGLILIGIYTRFAHLGQKVYTVDEVRGLLRASGYTGEELLESVYTGELVTNSQLQAYQTPSVEKSLGDALSAFADNPEHPPLYYLLMRFCLQLFQVPVASRWLAVGLSLLILPAVYWLCMELFGAAAVGWSAIALIAVSPFHVLIAQEARQYTLWALLAVVSSAFLLRSLRQNLWWQWLAYGIASVLGMYSHLFFLWVLLTHGLYVLLVERRLTQRFRRYLVVSVGVGIAFLPWVWVVATRLSRLEKTTRWANSYKTGLLDRAEYWLHNLGIGFVDFDWPVSFANPLSYLLLVGVAYSTYLLCRQTPKRVWLFVVLLMAVSTLAQVVPDILNGGRRSLLPRYSLTAYLGIELAVAYAIAQIFVLPKRFQKHSSKQFKSYRWRKDWAARIDRLEGKQIGVSTLLLGGVISSLLISQSLSWGKGSSALTLQAAPLINAIAQPVILTDIDYPYILSLSYQTSADTRFVLIDRENPDYATAAAQLPPGSRFSVYSASEPLLTFLRAAEDIEIEEPTGALRKAQLYQGTKISRTISQ